LVRAAADEDIRGLPGRDKVAQAIRDRVPVSASRYLKTPSVFGFHGVYRLLAHDTGIESGGRLGERGYELLNTWASEQGLDGFCGTGGGPGKAWRGLLVDALRDGLAQCAVPRKSGWQGWRFFADHLSPDKTGPREAQVIASALRDATAGFRGSVLEFLISNEGRRIWGDADDPSERAFHDGLLGGCDPSLRGLLEAIQVYERFSRIM